MAPENSMAAFEEAAKIPEIVGLETDVMISMDGVPFVLHDPHLVRTTDVASKCPLVDPFANASLLYFANGSCPLAERNVGEWFVKVRRALMLRYLALFPGPIPSFLILHTKKKKIMNLETRLL